MFASQSHDPLLQLFAAACSHVTMVYVFDRNWHSILVSSKNCPTANNGTAVQCGGHLLNVHHIRLMIAAKNIVKLVPVYYCDQ